MKKVFILLILILTFGILKGQSLYEKYALPVIKMTNDTTYKPLKKSSVLVTPKVRAGQYYDGYFVYKSIDQGQHWTVHRGDSTNNYAFDKEMIA